MWSEKTTFHAIPNIVANEQMPLKLMWSICLIASVSYCCRILTFSIIDYYQYKVLTKFEIVAESASNFPTITICNLNPYDLSKNRSLGELSRRNLIGDGTVVDPAELFALGKQRFLSLADASALARLKFTMSDMLVSCYFNETACNRSDFRLIENEAYGNCYAFNSNMNEESRLTSEVRRTNKYKASLRLELFVGNNESMSPMAMRSGAIMFIKNHTTGYVVGENGIELKPGTQTEVMLNRMVIKKLPMPFNDCVDESVDSSFVSYTQELTMRTFGYYDQEICRQLFYQRLLVAQCNCYDSRFVFMFDTSAKLYSCTQLLLPNACYKQMRSRFLANTLNSSNECPSGCESINYKPLLHYSEYPSDFYKQILVKNDEVVDKLAATRDKKELKKVSELDFRSSLLMVDVYFESDSYTKITEVPETSFSQLLANLGGQFGLFLG